MWNEIMNNTEENSMWNFDELFAEGNVVGVKGKHDEDIIIYVINDENVVSWNDFKNDDLDCHYLGEQIEYIVKLDNHGNSIVLFDREKDIPISFSMPELKNGMFVKFAWWDTRKKCFENSKCEMGTVFPDFGKVFTETGRSYYLKNIEKITNEGSYQQILIAIYSDKIKSIKDCGSVVPIWIHPTYKKYMDNIEK